MKMNKNLTMYTRNNKNPNLNQEKKRKTHISFFKLLQYGINAIEMVVHNLSINMKSTPLTLSAFQAFSYYLVCKNR